MAVLLDRDPVQPGMRKSRGACHNGCRPATGSIKRSADVTYAAIPSCLPAQRPRETKLMAIGVADVKVALSPFRVAGHGRGLAPGRQRTLVQCIDVVDIEDDAPPPGPAPFSGLGYQIEIAGPGPKAGKGSRFAAVQHGKRQGPVEWDSPSHIVGRERDCADPLDHDVSSSR